MRENPWFFSPLSTTLPFSFLHILPFLQACVTSLSPDSRHVNEDVMRLTDMQLIWFPLLPRDDASVNGRRAQKQLESLDLLFVNGGTKMKHEGWQENKNVKELCLIRFLQKTKAFFSFFLAVSLCSIISHYLILLNYYSKRWASFCIRNQALHLVYIPLAFKHSLKTHLHSNGLHDFFVSRNEVFVHKWLAESLFLDRKSNLQRFL